MRRSVVVVRATAEVVVEKKVNTDFHLALVDLYIIKYILTLNCDVALQERKLGPLERGGTLSGDQAAGKARRVADS